MDSSFQAEAVIGAGRGALIGAAFGAGWIGWGLSSAKAFNALVGPAFGSTALIFLAGSIYFLRKGRQLRKQHPAADASARKPILKRFLLIVLLEIVAIALAAIMANRLHRPDLATDWCAMIVGIHFLPLARIFRAPQLNILGSLMVLWCLLCWALFQPGTIAVAASLGTGALLWGRCVLSLLRAQRIVHALSI